MVVANGQEDEDGESRANGSPGLWASFFVCERGKEVLEDVEPDQSSVKRERDVDKDIVEQVGRGENTHLDIQSPDEKGVDDQQNLAHDEPVISL